jgi:hypothetical protein
VPFLRLGTQHQKIAAFGGAHKRVGAAEGCDLLIFIAPPLLPDIQNRLADESAASYIQILPSTLT